MRAVLLIALAVGGFFAGLGVAFVREVRGAGSSDRAETIGDVAAVVTERLHLARLDAADPLLSERIIVVSGEINELSGGLVCQKLLWLDRRDPTRSIDLYLRTNGGWIADACAVLDVMRAIRPRVNVHAIGTCESAGAMILAGATGRRVAWPQAMIMVHVIENPSDEPNSLDEVNRGMLEAFWRAHAALPDDLFPMRRDRVHYLTPQQALAYRMIDQIGDRDLTAPTAATSSPAP